MHSLYTYSIRWLIAAGLAVFLACALPASAQAFFTNDALASANSFTLGTLGFSVDTNTLASSIGQTGTTTTSFTTSDSGSIAPQYVLSVEKGICADEFYNGLQLQITQGSVVYEGGLLGAEATSTGSGTWSLALSAGSAIAALGDTCEADLHVRAYQTQFPAFNTGGFTDEETITLTLTASEHLGRNVVLNEVLPNPEGADNQGGLQGEWVELYNTGGSPVDISGWYIKDEANNQIVISAGTTMNGQTTIGTAGSGLEWVVVFMSGAILNNDGDTVYLYDSNDVLRDSYAYGASANDADSDSNNTPLGDNSGPAGSETSGQEGKSDARIPDGADNWVDPVPTPGAPNTVEQNVVQKSVKTETLADAPDVAAPIITLNGLNPTIVVQGSVYSDLGASVTDNTNHNLGVAMDDSDVDTDTIGTYFVYFRATDQAGNTAHIARTVVVYDSSKDAPELESLPLISETPDSIPAEVQSADALVPASAVNDAPVKKEDDDVENFEIATSTVPASVELFTASSTSAGSEEKAPEDENKQDVDVAGIATTTTQVSPDKSEEIEQDLVLTEDVDKEDAKEEDVYVTEEVSQPEEVTTPEETTEVESGDVSDAAPHIAEETVDGLVTTE